MSPDCLPTSPSEALPPRLRARHPDTTLLGNGRRALMRVNDGYRGVERASQQSFDAAFAHILTFRDGLIDGLTQITDTGSWPVPPATAEAP